MVEILAASLVGANHSFEASSLFDDMGAPPALGQMIIVIDPRATGGSDTASRLGQLAAMITRDPDVRLPGRRGRQSRQSAAAEGLVLADDIAQLFRQ
jgi:(2R)-3-sulfolactate dehydrogenase (NADP+)